MHEPETYASESAGKQVFNTGISGCCHIENAVIISVRLYAILVRYVKCTLEGWKAELTWWLVTYRDGVHARRQSPIQVLTWPGVE